ncbi:hypothetical protein [Cytobacillus purgationiresistens]|nr:hypothetical protein [Cytobacillus purgationiresistens]
MLIAATILTTITLFPILYFLKIGYSYKLKATIIGMTFIAVICGGMVELNYPVWTAVLLMLGLIFLFMVLMQRRLDQDLSKWQIMK